MNVHFIDTSVFVNILDIKNMNENRSEIMKELLEMVKNKTEVLILPFATIIESGNHIAHQTDGNQRRQTAERFSKYVMKTIAGEAPWSYYGEQMTPEELTITCTEFPDFAMREEGFGDLSIIRAYERYKIETPAISRIRIWSLDNHLKSYDETLHIFATRN